MSATIVAPAPGLGYSQGAAAVLSFFIPGLGQLYRGKIGMGIIWFVCTVIGYVCMIVPGLLIHLFCIIDAYHPPKPAERDYRPSSPIGR